MLFKRRFRDETKDSLHSRVSTETPPLLPLEILTTLKLILNYVPNRKQLRRNYLCPSCSRRRRYWFLTSRANARQTPHVRRSRNGVYTERTISLDLEVSRAYRSRTCCIWGRVQGPHVGHISVTSGQDTVRSPARFLFPSVVFLLLSRRRGSQPVRTIVACP